MKTEIRKILENTYAYNVENDRVIDEILTLFNVNDTEVEKLYGKTHTIKRIYGDCHAELKELENNQSVCWGDGKTFYYLLTEKPKL